MRHSHAAIYFKFTLNAVLVELIALCIIAFKHVDKLLVMDKVWKPNLFTGIFTNYKA